MIVDVSSFREMFIVTLLLVKPEFFFVLYSSSIADIEYLPDIFELKVKETSLIPLYFNDRS